MKRKKLICISTAIVLSLFGCYPEGPQYTDELDLVITNYDNTYTFAGNNTYAMPDSVVKITGAFQQGNPPVFLSEPVASIILNNIASNMASLGYTRVGDVAQAHFILFPSEVEVTYTDVYYDYYYYWDWYYPCCYGWYYPYPMVTSYTTGTIFMNLIPAHETTASGKLHVVWTGLLNGVLDYTGSYDRITKGINQAFTQSTYLHQ